MYTFIIWSFGWHYLLNFHITDIADGMYTLEKISVVFCYENVMKIKKPLFDYRNLILIYDYQTLESNSKCLLRLHRMHIVDT